MIEILRYLKDPKLWGLWYMPHYGQCKIYIINHNSTPSFKTTVSELLLAQAIARHPWFENARSRATSFESLGCSRTLLVTVPA